MHLLLQVDGDVGDGFLGHPPDEPLRLVRENGSVLLEGGGIELVVGHFTADAPVLPVVRKNIRPLESSPTNEDSK